MVKINNPLYASQASSTSDFVNNKLNEIFDNILAVSHTGKYELEFQMNIKDKNITRSLCSILRIEYKYKITNLSDDKIKISWRGEENEQAKG